MMGFYNWSTGNAIASEESVRVTPSLRSQKGMIWSKEPTNFDWYCLQIGDWKLTIESGGKWISLLKLREGEGLVQMAWLFGTLLQRYLCFHILCAWKAYVLMICLRWFFNFSPSEHRKPSHWTCIWVSRPLDWAWPLLRQLWQWQQAQQPLYHGHD